MPLIVKDFTWSQTEKTIHIRIPIPAVSHESVDVFTSDSYLKVHFVPYLFEVFLLHDIDNDQSKCIVKEDLITLDLYKRDNIEWEALEKELTKPEKMKLRQEIHEKSIEKATQEKEDRRIKKSQLERFTVQQAMEIDTKQHNLMDKRRDDERKSAMDALEEWKIKNDRTTTPTNKPRIHNTKTYSDVTITEIHDDDVEGAGDGAKVTELPAELEQPKNIRPKSASKTSRRPVNKVEKTPVKSEYVEKKKAETATRVLPKLRATAELEVTHTPRTFPTPSRESTANEEQAWLKNITMARRATGFVSEDLRPEEQDPQWCKEKGDEFFRNGNFLGAISAYTHGITLSDKLPSLYANRSATHFALGNFNKCMEDCSTAIDLMKPPCEGNRMSRAKCIARRAAALARVGFLSKAIDEMKAASKLVPDDETIKKDIYDMERAWEQNPDSE